MSVRPTRKSSALVASLVILALLLPVRSSSSADLPSPATAGAAPAEAAPPASSPTLPAPSTAQRPLAELLRPDGTLDLNSGYRGSLDPAGWHLAEDGAAPRFVPATAPVAGDEYWADGFNVPGIIGGVDALATDDAGNLYAGGWFNTGQVDANGIGKWDGTGWSPLGSGMEGISVYALAVDGVGNLYAGGGFTTAGGVSANYVAQWDGTAWSPLGSGMSGGPFSAVVWALAVDGDDNLYAGGYFTTAGGVSANGIAKWDGTAWSPLGSGMDSDVWALAVDGDDNLYAGGEFTTAGGVSANGIAKWDGTAWSRPGQRHELRCPGPGDGRRGQPLRRR